MKKPFPYISKSRHLDKSLKSVPTTDNFFRVLQSTFEGIERIIISVDFSIQNKRGTFMTPKEKSAMKRWFKQNTRTMCEIDEYIQASCMKEYML